ncbi:hypothetical protein FISHEDRAFT_6575, partial [Fistulina hepatica ATCC 64428]
SFTALHFDYYNCMTTRGEDAPAKVHPDKLYVQGTGRTNRTQFVPYSATDLKNYRREWDNMCTAMDGIFAWIEDSLQKNCPQQFEEIRMYTEMLPSRISSPVYPFAGFVLNFNVATRIHRDHQDEITGCGILIVGNHKGGELCLVEPGVVIEARNGDFIFFLSRQISHFNLHY